MKSLLTALLTLCLIVPAVAYNTYQTDWSGGGGVDGPVTDWGDEFDAATRINWLTPSGEFTLGVGTYCHGISGVSCPDSLYSADIDGDGDMDVLAVEVDIIWYENNGSGGGWTRHTVNGSNASSVYSADIDDDGDMDVLGAVGRDDDITWWENNGSGGGWTTHTVDGDFGWASSVYAADIDDDGDLDVLGAAYDDDDISWWENNGSGGGWAEHVVDGDFNGATSVYSADIDGDGDMDVLGTAALANDITWWENDGSGCGWAEHTVDGHFTAAQSVYAADIDGDGDLDILGAARGAADITWWENDGSGGGWAEHLVDGHFTAAQSVYAGDIDGDGDTDVLGAACSHHGIAWWENNGSGGGWRKYTVYDCDSTGTVHSADIDGDGCMDLLGSIFIGTPEVPTEEILWWSIERGTNGNLTSSILDTAALPEWGQISWTADTPMDTTLSVEVRASSDSSSMGSWIAVSSGDELGDYLTDYDRYFQYKVYLSTSDPSTSPTFEDVTISWTDHTTVESVDLFANSQDEGVLLSWSIVGDTPATISVLRAANESQPTAFSGELTGSATSWLDVSAEAGVEYAYYLEVTELDGTVSRFGPSEVVVPGAVSELALSDPYPNPADESLTIHYELTQNATVKLHIYDVAGRLVETLVSGEQTAGRYSVSWDSSTAATGVYLLRLEANGEAITKRAVISR